jgi:hypothetical protein
MEALLGRFIKHALPALRLYPQGIGAHTVQIAPWLLNTGLSQKSFFVAVFIEHMGVFYATTIWQLASVMTPAPYVSCPGQAASRAFEKENTMGSATAQAEGSSRATGADWLCCG